MHPKSHIKIFRVHFIFTMSNSDIVKGMRYYLSVGLQENTIPKFPAAWEPVKISS